MIKVASDLAKGLTKIGLPALLVITLFALFSSAQAQPYLGNGIKIGEVTSHSAIIWTRLTERAEPNWNGLEWLGTDNREFDVGTFGKNNFPKGPHLPIWPEV